MAVEIIFAAIVWWSVAIPIMALGILNTENLEDSVVIGVFWPIFIPLMCIGMLWQALFKSAAHIRNDLHNRKLVGEFNEWLDARETVEPETEGDAK